MSQLQASAHTDYSPVDPYAIILFENESVGNELAQRILNMLKVASQEVDRLRKSLESSRRTAYFMQHATDAALSDLVKRSKHHKQQRKLWQRRCKAVFRQTTGRSPTISELDAIASRRNDSQEKAP